MKKRKLILSKENLRKELERLYEEKTRKGMEGLQKYDDDWAPTITVVDVKGNEYDVPIISDKFDYVAAKEEVAAKVKKILRKKGGLAVISVGDGWEGRYENTDSKSPKQSIVEIFYAIIESVPISKTRTWRIRRDANGKRIFPLGDSERDGSPMFSRFTENYFKVS